MSKIAHMHQIIAETEKSTNELNRLLNLAFYEGEDDQTYASFMNIFQINHKKTVLKDGFSY